MPTTPLKTFLFGFKRTLPFQSGVIPFGLMYATIASAAGFPWWLTILLTVVVFGGSSQLVFIDLLHTIGSPLQAVLGSNILNARHMIYSAGVSFKFSNYPIKWKLLLSYFLTDQLYAIALLDDVEKNSVPEEQAPWFYFGSGFCTWIFWMAANFLGIAFGQFIPESWNLSFAVPLMFLPLIFSVSKNRFAYLTAILAILFVCLLKDLPYGLGVVFSILLASCIGFFVQRKMEKKS